MSKDVQSPDPERWQKQLAPCRGLEVVTQYNGIELVPDRGLQVAPTHGLESALEQAAGLETYASSKDLGKEFVVDPPPIQRRWFQRKRYWVTATVSILVVIALVGISLAVILKQKDQGDAHSTSDQDTTPPSPTTSAIASLSPLTATAFGTENGDYAIKVIYQDDEGWLRSSTYESETKAWKKDGRFTPAKKGTPLAITRFNAQADQTRIQLEIFHLDDNNKVSEWTWDSSTSATGRGSMNGWNFTASPTSKLSAYWPYILSQDEQNKVQAIMFDGSAWVDWNFTSAGLDAREGSSLAVLPTGRERGDDVTVFFQDEEGVVMECQEDARPREALVGLPSSLTTSLRTQPSLTTFSTNSTTTSSTTITYTLYQDPTSTIQMIWRSSSSSSSSSSTWSGPKTFDAFKGADNGTDIACIATSAYYHNPTLEGLKVPRCYFQAGGKVREVELVGDGEGWRVLGDVPVDI